jgi:RNA polymerase sigma-70 factor (ECF subfamily)
MTGDAPALIGREADTKAAIEVKAFQAAGDLDGARERFAELVARHQRRALRIAFHYVRDSADADEAVQDAFVKAYSHIATFRDELPFEVWFTRILINGCLDRLKARKRREKWLVPPSLDASGVERNPADLLPSRGPSPEEYVLRQERRRQLQVALGQLPERQRMVFALSHFEGRSSREVSQMTGLSESTIRVHLFRAIRRLRGLLVKGTPRTGAGSRRISRAAH